MDVTTPLVGDAVQRHRSTALFRRLPQPWAAIAYCLLLFVGVQAQSRKPSLRCVRPEPGRFLVTGGHTQRCPCYFNAAFEATVRHRGLNISVYAVPLAEYRQWVREVKRIKRQRPVPLRVGDVALNNITLTHLRGWYTWRSDTLVVEKRGTYVAFAAIALERDMPSYHTCLWYRLVLESRPEVCPLRLKERKTPLGASHAAGRFVTHVIGGMRINAGDEFLGYNALISSGNKNCTGSVIAAEWILTAAHCSVRIGSVVHVGGVTVGDGDVYYARVVVPHPQFHGVANDIALVQLASHIRNPRIMPLNSRRDGPLPGTIVRATGYGVITNSRAFVGLRMVDMAVLSEGECKRRIELGGNPSIAHAIDDTMHLCTGRDSECRRGGVCFGDSGGPIVSRMPDDSLVQVGVTSFGIEPCGSSASPDIFTRVSSHLSWIKQVTGNAARVVEWQSVDNFATGGSYGTPWQSVDNVTTGGSYNTPASSGFVFPVWGVIAIVIGVCVNIVLIAVIIIVRRSTCHRDGKHSSPAASAAQSPTQSQP